MVTYYGAVVYIAASADRSTESTKLLSTDLLCFVVGQCVNFSWRFEYNREAKPVFTIKNRNFRNRIVATCLILTEEAMLNMAASDTDR